VNEYSARYSILDNEFYVPKARASRGPEQGQPPGPRRRCSAGKEAERVFAMPQKDAELVYEHYMEMLNEGEAASRSIPSARAWPASLRA
jgi:thymidylate synthase (FAD)